MRLLKCAVLALTLLVGAHALPAAAGATDPLFINLLTDDGHRGRMALTFGQRQHDRGHPLTIFFNDKGVLLVSKANADKFGPQQKMIAELVAKGATILVCPMCMQHYGVKVDDLIPGAKPSNPDLIGAALFKDNTKTLTW